MVDCRPGRGAPSVLCMVSGPCAVMVLVLALLFAPFAQPTHADDFVADAQCVEGHWYVTIYDASLHGGAGAGKDAQDPLDDSGLVPGVSIRTIASAGSSDVKSTFETDKGGSFFLAPEYNTGWVWLSKPGYNDQKVRSSCDTTYDAFSYSEQFASYCYDYTYQAIPMTYLPAIAGGHRHVESVAYIMDFFDGQITSRDETIKKQAQEIKALADTLGTGSIGSVSGNATLDALSNDTRDALCLLHVDDATGMAYETLGMLYAQRSGILAESRTGGIQAIQYDDIDAMQSVLDAGVAAYCDNTGRAPEASERIETGLEALQVLYAELRRQAANLQYESLMLSLASSSYAQQQQQPYRHYYNNYHADGSGNDGRGSYHHDATGSRPYDYGSHDTIRNYNPEDHEDHGHGHGDCITFCDRHDYEPDWARYLDKPGAREACWDVEADPERIGTADWYWCKDLDRYLSGLS